MLVGVITCFAVTLALLAWVGWRYFIGSAEANAASPLIAAALPSSPTPRQADVGDIGKPVRHGGLTVVMYSSVGLAVLLVAATAGGVLALSERIALAPLNASDFERQQHIQAALNPEALVPPQMLPPSVFVGTERPGLETADRDWSRLNPEFMRTALTVFARLEARGYVFVLLEGYRSPERQDSLADGHARVTNARAFQSKHQYGLALDAAPMRNGKLVISEKDAWAMQAYQAFGEEAEKAGLIWGGRWQLRDYGHIEAPGMVAAYLKGK